MAGYNQIKSQRAVPIGTVQPWTGDLTEIPSGWLICNNAELNANEYPLLARILNDTYGGNMNGVFPNYFGSFRVPLTNDKALADISDEFFGFKPGGSTTPWSANAFVNGGQIITNAGLYYTVLGTGQLGATAPTHSSGTEENGDVQLKWENPLNSNVPSSKDNSEALSVVSAYIGNTVAGFEPGDLSPPNIQDARTDIKLTYVPDPEGTIVSIEVAGGLMPTTGAATLYTITWDQVDNSLTNVLTGDPVTGQDAAFAVVVDPATSGYQAVVKTKGFGFKPGDQVLIKGSKFSDNGGSDGTHDLTIQINSVGSAFFEGQLTGMELFPGFGLQPVYIVPRKLGRNHMRQHFHQELLNTINVSDSADRPGDGVTVWASAEWEGFDPLNREDPCYDVSIEGLNIEICTPPETWECTPDGPVIYIGNGTSSDVTIFSGSPFTAGAGRYAIGSVLGGRIIIGNKPLKTNAKAHGIGRLNFEMDMGVSHKNLRAGAITTANHSSNDGSQRTDVDEDTPFGTDEERLMNLKKTGRFYSGHKIPFSDDTSSIQTGNFDPGPGSAGIYGTPFSLPGNFAYSDKQHGPTTTLFDHDGIHFGFQPNDGTGVAAEKIIDSHDHQGEFNIQYDGSNLKIIPTEFLKVQPNLTPDQLEDALQIRFTTRVASLAVLNLIRAY